MFFQMTPATDHIYARVRDRAASHESDGHDFIEDIWRESAAYLDVDLAQRAPAIGLVPSFCEMYFAHALKFAGIKLVTRSERSPKRQGPDLFARDPDVWIEAAAATPGTGPDKLEWGHGKVPNDRFILRLTEEIEKKIEQLQRHIDRGYIRAGQSTVIAVSGAMLPYRYSEAFVPRVVRAVFG